MENAYVAGFFDGEGCVCIQSNFQVRVVVCQSDPDVLRMIQSKFGGRLFNKGKSALSTRDAWQLQFTKKTETVPFLQAIQPYAIVKSRKIKIALEMLALTQSNKTRLQNVNGHFQRNPNSEMRESLLTQFKNN